MNEYVSHVIISLGQLKWPINYIKIVHEMIYQLFSSIKSNWPIMSSTRTKLLLFTSHNTTHTQQGTLIRNGCFRLCTNHVKYYETSRTNFTSFYLQRHKMSSESELWMFCYVSLMAVKFGLLDSDGRAINKLLRFITNEMLPQLQISRLSKQKFTLRMYMG